MYEVEKRILLQPDELSSFLDKLKDQLKVIKEFKRFTIVNIDNPDFKPNTDSLIDIKIRTSHDESLFTLKSGNWHADVARKESEIHFEKNEIKNLIEILVALGKKYFVAMYVTRQKYRLQDFIMTVDKYHHMKEILVEIELAVESNIDGAEKTINEFLEKYKLNALDSESTVRFIKSINEIKETQIDFTKISIEDWYLDWKDFIECTI